MQYKHSTTEATFYYRDSTRSVYHREDGPAVEWFDGSYAWYYHGSLHRIGGPAYKTVLGNLYWYRNGYKHNPSGPAVVFYNEKGREWWTEGRKHRLDGPAVETGPLSEWWLNGKRHRLDGPAFHDSSGVYPSRYFIDGKLLSKEEWLLQIPEELKYKMIFNQDFITGK